MNKNLLLNGLKTLITLGLLCSLVVPAATLAQAPVTKTIKQESLIIENVKPVAQPDEYTAEAGTMLSVPAPGVLANDYDADGDALTAILVAPPANGVLSLHSDGSFEYTPTTGFSGDDHFTYKAYDGALNSVPVLVTIGVTGGANTAPVANADSYTTDVDLTLIVDALTGVLANDYDADGDALTAQLVISPVNGSLSFQADGSFEYTPDVGYTGDDHFTYRAFDGLVTSAPAMVTITVSGTSSAPIAAADTYTTTMNTMLTVPVPGVLINDTDPDLDPLTAELTGVPIQFGDLTFNSDGSFTYVPDTNYYGSVFFTYRAFDGTEYSTPVQVTIDVQSTNTAPVAVADSYLMLMGTTLSVDVAHGVLANDTDADGDPLTAELLGIPLVNGVLNFNSDGSFTYTPNAGVFGDINFTYQAEDWLDNSTPVLVTITVKEVNTAPVAVADAYLVAPDVPLAVASAGGVLVNDSDVENDALEAQLVDNVDNGTLTLNSDGSFLYTPNLGFEGVDTFTYRAFDGLAASVPVGVTIYVTDDNLAPFGVADSYTMAVGAPLWVEAPGVLANDYDLNGTSLIAQLQHGVDHGTLWFNIDGSFEYVPEAGFMGVDSFTYRAYDGELLSPAVTVTISVWLITYMPMMHK
jgi:VCBS repeat-containing protein